MSLYICYASAWKQRINVVSIQICILTLFNIWGRIARAVPDHLLHFTDTVCRTSFRRQADNARETASSSEVGNTRHTGRFHDKRELLTIAREADWRLLLESIYTVVATTAGALNSLYPALIIALSNCAPYFKHLSVNSSNKLISLFNAFVNPSFLLSDEGHPRLLFFLYVYFCLWFCRAFPD